MQRLRVNTIYRTIQGEGHHTGKPVILVRLQGCRINCEFCDTKDALDPRGGEWLTPEELMAAIWSVREGYRTDTILLTGGEPLEQNLDPFLKLVNYRDWGIHLETNGNLPMTDMTRRHFTWVTLSPKVGYPVCPPIAKNADELKWLVGGPQDIQGLLNYLVHYPTPFVFVQPISNELPNSLEIAYEAALRYNWGLSVQTHKLIGKP
jgi:7-carboxy-7-deazaguanine synthase